LAFKSNEKSSTTHHVEGNNMTSLTQTVVGKGIPNPLKAEGMLKILGDLVPPSPSKNPFPILLHGMVGPQKYLYPFFQWNEHRLITLTINL